MSCRIELWFCRSRHLYYLDPKVLKQHRDPGDLGIQPCWRIDVEHLSEVVLTRFIHGVLTPAISDMVSFKSFMNASRLVKSQSSLHFPHRSRHRCAGHT